MSTEREWFYGSTGAIIGFRPSNRFIHCANRKLIVGIGRRRYVAGGFFKIVNGLRF